ncbi:MAG: hypothetical protein Alis3KO_28590 [Aliiglaciecola sp.]
MVDFTGAAKSHPDPYNKKLVIETMAPHFQALTEDKVTYFVDATPNYIGRDATLLRKIAEATGINILTNTGLYGARDKRFIPHYALEYTAEQLSKKMDS